MKVYEFTKQVLEQTGKGMLILDGRWVVRYANPQFCRLTGLGEDRVTGQSLADLCGTGRPGWPKPGQPDQPSQPGLPTAPDLQTDWQGILAFNPGRGPAKSFGVRISRFRTEKKGRPVFLLSIDSPAGHGTAGTTDDVTGLPGVDIFLDRVEQAVRFSRREKSKTIMFLIRLDRFNLVTDGLGREYGDRVIREVAGRLRRSIRESDTIARVDRNSFGLLLKMAKETHASLVAEKVLQAISEPVRTDGQSVVVTASIGIAACSDPGESPDSGPADKIMASAEIAMHTAGQMGGNTYRFFAADLNEKARERIEMENNLRIAVEAQEFLLYYQPKVDIGTNRIVGAEALIRWNRPGGGMVAPFHFIPVAEETGIIIDIGRWVLNEACRQNRAWQAAGLTVVPVAVNVSPRQFQYPGFYKDVETAVRSSGLDPDLLELEITESMLMSDVEQMIQKLKQLSGVGLNLSIDDFGTGYSNLSYLVRFPVSTLKIDRAFVKDLGTDDTIDGLTHSIIRMSKNLNLKIVAEGAENEQHIAFLKAHGCDVVQGYYYSKPLPADEFAKLLKTGIIQKK